MWLNNPIRPLEACGTSGMKAAMNGVLNLTILDGWWPEGCEHGVNGWAIGDESRGRRPRGRGARSTTTLENEVLPAYADRARWIAMMQASIAMGAELFSSDRMVQRVLRQALSRRERSVGHDRGRQGLTRAGAIPAYCVASSPTGSASSLVMYSSGRRKCRAPLTSVSR